MGKIQGKKNCTNSNVKVQKKSRNGCSTCKRRKKKCDETKPICDTCRRLSLQCSYIFNLNWQKNNQITLQSNRNTDYVTEHNTKNKNCKFINFSRWDIVVSYKFDLPSVSIPLESFQLEKFQRENKTEEEYQYGAYDLESFTLSELEISLLRSDSEIGPKMSEQFLFSLYKDVLSRTKSFAKSDSASNDFIHIVIPGCQKFPALYCSVLALSALDLMKAELMKPHLKSNKRLVRIYNSLFVGYKNDAFNFLHNILDGFDIEAVEMLEEIILTIILLTNIEITNKGSREWIRYMTEASFIFTALTDQKILDSDIFKFAYKYFSLRYILLLTTLDKVTMCTFMESAPWPIVDEFFQNDKIEPMFGCSPQLLYTIYNSTISNNLYETGKIEIHVFVARLNRLWYYLDINKQQNFGECNELTMCANSYFHATKIYLYTMLKRTNLEKFLDDEFESHMPKLWEELSELSLSRNSLFFPNWCFLILVTTDLMEEDDNKRVKALELQNALEINWPLSSVVQIRKAIESIWKIYDLSLIRDSNQIDNNKGINFDWRNVLREFQFMLSLT